MTFPARSTGTGNKYGARKTVYNGEVYDSKLEADVAQALDLLEKRGDVVFWLRQQLYELAPKRKGERSVAYIADFDVCFVSDVTPEVTRTRGVVIEAKGYQTQAWRVKRRWFMEKYPTVELRVVKRPEEVVAIAQEMRDGRAREAPRGRGASCARARSKRGARAGVAAG